MGLNRCIACGKTFTARAQSPQQSYCSNAPCQRERRRLWQREKRREDPDYRADQVQAHKAWLARHPDYWRQYREAHPEYVEQNRTQQRARRAEKAPDPVAKMDASIGTSLLKSGTYRLTLMSDDDVAKMDVWMAEITLISTA
jgi:hypothetical protein